MNSATNYATKRKDYGVVIDLLPTLDEMSSKIRVRVNDARKAIRAIGYVGLNSKAKELDDRAAEYESRMGVKQGQTPSTIAKKRYHLLCSAKGLFVTTYSYKMVKFDVETAIKAGTPVAILSPYKKPDMVKPKTLAEWELMCDREANNEWAKWADDLDINLDVILDTPTPWLSNATLRESAACYQDFNAFLNQITMEMVAIEESGDWDIDLACSVVYNEKASVWRNASTRKVGSKYKYANKEFWYNYEILPVNIMTKYLHLTCLAAANWKPMKRYLTDGVEYGTKQYFEYCTEEDADMEQGLTITPIYADPYFEDDAEDLGGYLNKEYTPNYSDVNFKF